MKYSLTFFILFFCVFIGRYSFAQYNVQLTVKQVYSNAVKSCDLDGKKEHTWRVYVGSADVFCKIEETTSSPVTYSANTLIYNENRNQYFSIKVVGFEGLDRKDCDYVNNTCSGQREERIVNYNLANYQAGINNTLTIKTIGSKYQVKINLYYTLPAPETATIKNNGVTLLGNTCANIPIDLATNNNYPNTWGQTYDWQYRIGGQTYPSSRPNPAYCGDQSYCSGDGGFDPFAMLLGERTSNDNAVGPPIAESIRPIDPIDPGPCPLTCCCVPRYIYEDLPLWRTISGYTGNNISDINISSLPGISAGVSNNTSVAFKVRVRVGNYTSPFSSVQSAKFSAAAPTFTAAPSTSCKKANNGSITVNVTGNTGNYQYILRNGYNKNGCANPHDNDCLYDVEQSGTFTSVSKILTDVGDGAYTLAIGNGGGSNGVCFTSQNITVGSYPDIVLTATKANDVTCAGGSDGKINVSVSGGKPGSTFTFKANASTSNYTIINATLGYFSGLGAGTYEIEVSDGSCNEPKTKSIPISAPSPVTLKTANRNNDVTIVSPTCSANPNGSISIAVKGGSSKYNFELTGPKNVNSPLNSAANWEATTLPGGTYTLTVKDGDRIGCTALIVDNIVLDYVEPITLSLLNATDVTCPDLSAEAEDGTIQLSASGGTGSLHYYITGPENRDNTTGIFTNLQQGTYAAYAINDNLAGCTDRTNLSTSIHIGKPQLILISKISSKNLTCFDIYDGALSVAVSQGNGGFIYQWEYQEFGESSWNNVSPAKGGNSTELSGLLPANYRLQVTDSKGCPKTSGNFPIINPPANLQLQDIQISPISCKGAADANITATATGGWGGYAYQYSIDGGTTYTTFTTSTNFPSGDYEIQVVDANGCEEPWYDVVSIEEPTVPLTATVALSDYNGYGVSCPSATDGSITLNAAGGNGAAFASTYQYSINNGNNFSSQNIFTGLAAGSYQAVIKDNRGCNFSITALLSAPPAISFASIETNTVQCFGDETGYIEITPAGGVGSFSFSLNGASYQTTNRFENLTAGNYIITVQDGNNCTASTNATITQPNPPMEITFSTTNVSCFGQTDGIIKSTAKGGVLPYNYQWQNRSETINELTGLGAGNYTLTITDAVGCTLQASAEITAPEKALTASVLAQNSNCFAANNGALTISTEGGTPPYEYALGATNSFKPENVFSSLAPGNYTIKVRDKMGCETNLSAEIQEPALLELVLASKTNVLCRGAASGSIQVLASGGAGTYQYAIAGKPSQSEAIFNGLIAGKYTVKVEDSNKCQSMVEVVIAEPDTELQVTIQSIDAQCKGDANGSVEVTASGGTAPYKLTWLDDGSEVFERRFLVANSYAFLLEDAHGCTIDSMVLVGEPPTALVVTIDTSQNISCFGVTDGAISFDAVGGYPPYSYSFEANSFGARNTYEELSPGIYKLMVKDSVGCIAMRDLEIISPSRLIADISNQQNVLCYNGLDGQVAIAVNGGTAPYQFSIDSGMSFQQSNVFGSLPRGTYLVDIVDHNLCTTSVSFTISEPEELKATIAVVRDASCQQANGVLQASVSGGAAPYIYKWYNANNQELAYVALADQLSAGNYHLLVADANGCTLALTKAVSDQDGPSTSISQVKRASCFDASDGEATVTATGGKPGYTYLWNDEKTQTTATATGLKRGEYFVEVTDTDGCISIAEVNIGSPAELALQITTSTSPECFESCTGSINISVSGGVAPYSVTWPEGISGVDLSAEGICQGIFSVLVVDGTGCQKTFELEMEAPEPLGYQLLAETIPSCQFNCDGSLEVIGIGGTAPYSYQWNDVNKQNGSKANNLCAGAYELTITDHNDCAFTTTINLTDPIPQILELGGPYTLCLGQEQTVEAPIEGTTYSWKKNETVIGQQRNLTVSQGGIYHLTLTDLNGCELEDQFEVIASEVAFEANFLASTEMVTGDTLLLTEVCFPQPDSVKWSFDDTVTIYGATNAAQPMITYRQAGQYQVRLTAYYDVCVEEITKTIDFIGRDDSSLRDSINLGATGFDEVRVYPNPGNGLFKVEVSLHQAAEVAIFVYNVNGIEVLRKPLTSGKIITDEIDLRNQPTGPYVMSLVSNNIRKTVRLIKK